jgi:hypothetical protein
METKQRKAGRPKARVQTGPLVLEGERERVKFELEISPDTASELRDYVRWVAESSAPQSADSRTVDFALRDLFRRDRLWQEQRRKGQRPEAAAPPQASPSPTANGAAVASPRPASPPAVPAGHR